jgi:tetratricopeptide (TPR) repeat protein
MLTSLLLAAALVTREIPVTSRSPEAVQVFLQGREKALNFDTAEAVALFRKAVALDPDFPLALAWLGKLTQGPEGVVMAERAATLQGLSEAEKLSVDVLLAERKGEDEKVRKLKRQLADLAPGDWLAQFQLGVQSMYDHKSQAAILYLTKALKLNPDAAEAYNYLGYVLVQQGQIEDGIAKVKRFVELKPKESNSWDSLGEVLLLAGKLDEAESAFRKSAEIAPDDWMSWMGVAYSRFFRGDWVGGRAACAGAEKFITRAPDKLAVGLVLAWSYLAEGKSGEALKTVDALEKEALAKKDDFAAAWSALERAEMLVELHRPEEAQKQLLLAASRGDSSKVSGEEKNRLRRSALLLEARSGDVAVAGKALARLQGELAAAPSNEDLRGLVHFAEGLVAMARGVPQQAIESFSKCPETLFQCRLDLAAAQAKAGLKAPSDETLRKLSQANIRDSLHRGQDPSYLYISAALKGHGPAAAR